jgi:hypothetical protein
MSNDKSFTYKLLPQLPHPPQELIDLVDFDLKPEGNNIATMGKRQLIDWRGYTGSAYRNMRRVEEPFQSAYDKWLKENITNDYMNSSLMYCHGGNFADDAPSTGAHTDFTRDYVLMYNLRTGGDDAELCFWKEKDQELIRARQSGCENFEKLELIDSVRGPANVWYLINARILHSTENVRGLRLNLQVSFENSFPDSML